ncbi:hypothetical protein [Maribacter sp. HTCC2170]|uniref:hypothetical protein n=1 Tax=Maribacter sp. (strain HTCC2170 / KCCM 42371) TaxID=313603 RepID=UPI00006B47EB|nr:hypothetical protein [Maribacter sp. HTCC2170]EAR01686.1 hypothetical protein FB2170_14198 [Maribacter sp. HTCC2170]
MKKILFTLLLAPLLIAAQSSTESLIIENVMFSPLPGKTAEFEAGIADHNKKFHADGPYGVRIYNIMNGKNAGKYMNIMGPLPWSAIDGRPHSDAHNEDMSKNVNPYLSAEVEVNYMKMHPELSNFSREFEINKVSVFMIDIKRFKDMDFYDKVIKKVVKVYKEKKPDQLYGVYSNELQNMDGKDFGWVEFFDSSAWLGKEDSFPKDFEAVHGEGSFVQFLADLEATTNGEDSEVWVLRKDLSGPNAKVAAATGQ